MIREFEEETGLKTKESDWEYIGYMEKSGEFMVNCYKSFHPLYNTVQTKDEKIIITPLVYLEDYPLLPNIKWLIEFCLDRNKMLFAIDYDLQKYPLVY